ncbi:unnamed protein product [Moneuplotes crassus]|uniref:Uncharacterized protein n=1 Tax=Euplotes crassus TaxID=5936 RepID=A0AAD2CY35_EUPCR|nr:unnamed protein product [Moneuplotes crassus]
MSVICYQYNCDYSSAAYCQAHKVPICTNCRYNQHYKCKTQLLIPEESLKYQIQKVYELLVTIEELFEDLCFGSDFPTAFQIIQDFKAELVEIISDTLKAIDEEDFLSFYRHQRAINTLMKNLDKDEIITKLCSHIFQQAVFKKLEFRKVEDCFLNQEILSQESSSDEQEFDSKVDWAEEGSILARGIQDLEFLRGKFFGYQKKIFKNDILELNLGSQKYTNFMKECLKQNLKFPRVQGFTIANITEESELLKQYTEKCLLKEPCKQVYIIEDEPVFYSKYCSSFQKLIHSSLEMLTLSNYILTEADFNSIKEIISNTPVRIELTDCLLICTEGKKLSTMKEDDRRKYKISCSFYSHENFPIFSKILSSD